MCVGVATWGIIKHHERLVERSTTDPLWFSGADSRTTKGVAELDPNHSHLVLVDDGTVGEFGKEIALRSAVEDKLCDKEGHVLPPPLVHANVVDRTKAENDAGAGVGASSPGAPAATSVPGRASHTGPAVMVQLLVGGGPGSLETLIATLAMKRPVVVFADTGRSAAVITAAHRYLKRLEQSGLKGDALSRLENEPPSAEDLELREKQQVEMWATCPTLVLKILRLGAQKAIGGDQELLTFFSLDLDETEEDKLIEEAVLSGCGDAYDRVLLAVKWGVPSTMLRHLEGAAGRLSEGALSKIFHTALQTGRTDVVQTLINFGELIGCNPRSLRFSDFDALFSVEHDRYELYNLAATQRDREIMQLQLVSRSKRSAEPVRSTLRMLRGRRNSSTSSNPAATPAPAESAMTKSRWQGSAKQVLQMQALSLQAARARRSSAVLIEEDLPEPGTGSAWPLLRLIERTGVLRVRRQRSRGPLLEAPTYEPDVARDTLEKCGFPRAPPHLSWPRCPSLPIRLRMRSACSCIIRASHPPLQLHPILRQPPQESTARRAAEPVARRQAARWRLRLSRGLEQG